MFKNKIPSSSGTSTGDQGRLIRYSSTQAHSLTPAAGRLKQRAILNFEESFYSHLSHLLLGYSTDRNEMKMDKLEIENKKWIKTNLKMKDGLIKWTVKDKGEYAFHLESRSTNWDWDDCKGPAMGVNIELKMNLKKVT